MNIRNSILLAAIVLSSFTASAKNLLKNPGFEDGLKSWGFKEWSGKPYEVKAEADKANAHSGQSAAKIQWESGGDNFVLSQDVYVEKGGNFLLSFFAKAAVLNSHDTNCQATLRFFDANNKAIGGMEHKVFTINENWQELKWSFTAPAQTARLIVHLRCRRVTTWFDDAQLLASAGLYLKNAAIWPHEKQLLLELFNDGKFDSVTAELTGNNTRWQKRLSVPPNATTYAQLDIPELAAGTYKLTCQADGQPDIVVTQKLEVKDVRASWPAPYDKLNVRNNFVTELLVDNALKLEAGKPVPFLNPRNGWVLIQFKGKGHLTIDGQSQPIESGVEAMRQLNAGKHHIICNEAGTAAISITTMGECIASEYETDPVRLNLTDVMFSRGMKEFLRNSCVLMERFPNNRVMDVDAIPQGEEARLAAWRAQGKLAITNVLRPAYGSWCKVQPEASEPFWASRIGVQKLDGISIDEFGRETDAECVFYAPAVETLSKKFPGTRLYAYCNAAWYSHDNTRPLRKALIANHHLMAPELYMREQATEAQAKLYINDFFNWLRLWEKAEPNSLSSIIWTYGSCDGYYGNYCLDTFANADYRVFLDLQFYMAANDPTLWGMRGVCPWIIRYTTKDTLLWSAKLVRHYLIEGKRTLLSKEYALNYNGNYLQNADFAKGLDAWTVEAAEENQIGIKVIKDYGFNRGTRNTAPDGDQTVVMHRTKGKVNKISQQIKNLKPGKCYEITVRSCDCNDAMDTHAKLKLKLMPLRLTVEGADLLLDKSIILVYPTDQKTGRDDYLCGNHTKVTFRATSDTAKVIISDEMPNLMNRNFHGYPYNQADINQKAVAFNFVQVTELLEE